MSAGAAGSGRREALLGGGAWALGMLLYALARPPGSLRVWAGDPPWLWQQLWIWGAPQRPLWQLLAAHLPDALHATGLTLLTLALARSDAEARRWSLAALAWALLLEGLQCLALWGGRFDPLDLAAIVGGWALALQLGARACSPPAPC